MLPHYIKVAFRNLLRNKFYSAINILGLAVGLACFVLILLFVQDEQQYDRYHSKADRIYRLVEKIEMEGQGENSSSNPFPTGPAVLNDYPHLVEHVVRFFNWQTEKMTLNIGDPEDPISIKKFNEPHIFFADSTAFQVFDFPLAKGNPEAVLKNPNSIVLSQQLATKYFGDEDPMGQQVLYEGQLPLLVTGVMDKVPAQSHFHMEALISFSTLKTIAGPNFGRSWVWNPNWTYILLKEGVAPAELEAQFPLFVEKYYPDFIKTQVTHSLQPLTAIHLTSDLDYEIRPNNKKSSIYIFMAIGIFILLIACINFMNLATARSARRAQEVGMRKVLGAKREQLIFQFLGESILMSVAALLVAMGIVRALLPIFNQLTDKTLVIDMVMSPSFVLMLAGIGLMTGVVAGLYPAFFLSSFLPAKVIKSKYGAIKGSRFLRKSLVVLQFAISLGLIIGTAVIYQQHQYMQSAELGFEKEAILIIPTKQPMIPKYEVFKEALLQHPDVLHVSHMNEIIGVHHNIHEYNYEGMEPGQWIYFPSLIVDEDFLQVMDIELIAGRNFSESHPTDDTLAVLINEAMIKELGWGSPEEVLDKRFNTIRGRERVIGVVKDFNAVSLNDPIRPFVLDIGNLPFFMKNVVVRFNPNNLQATLKHMETAWADVAPNHPFEYSFLGEQLDQLYAKESRLTNLVAYFSILAVLIACLGLFALASFTAEQRTKEIGLRKVLGASVGSIARMLATDFVKLVLISGLLAFPVAWYFMQQWLDSFAFHTAMPWWVFGVSLVTIMVISVLTVSYQAVKAGLTNPAEALQDE